jgi:hypothetical protein
MNGCEVPEIVQESPVRKGGQATRYYAIVPGFDLDKTSTNLLSLCS